MNHPEIELRPALQRDLPFIFACWLRSYRHGSQFAKKISNSTFYTWHHRLIEGIIKRGAQVRIAHPKGDPDTILGFSCVETFEDRPLIQYVYIKKIFRGMGITKLLVPELTENARFTHLMSKMNLEKHPNLEYNPYLV